MKLSKLYHISFLALGVLMAGLVSCSDELVAPVSESNLPIRENGLSFRCADMLEVNYGAARSMSRAGGAKEVDEKEVKTVHVFFFKKDGDQELLTANFSNFPAYQKITDGGFLKIYIPNKESDGENYDRALFSDKNGQDVNEVLVVAIANIDATDEVSEDPEIDYNTFYTDYSEHGRIRKAARSAMPEGKEAEADNYKILKIDKLSDLKSWVYYPNMRMDEHTEEGDIENLPDAGMPMLCDGQIVDISDNTKTLVINMIALMAKINVAIKLVPDQWTAEYPTLEIKSYGVRNMPIAVPFEAPTGYYLAGKSGRPESPGDFETCKGLFSVTTQPMYHIGGSGDGGNECTPEEHEFLTTLPTSKIITRNTGTYEFTYYTYENINVPDYAAERANGDDAFVANPDYDSANPNSSEYKTNGWKPQYPDGVEGHPEEYQRWKSTLAYNFRASALVIKGVYTNHQGMHYNAQFTVYLGSDADKDFTVKRNHQYDNAITIKGLDYIRNSTDDVYTFDGRVNVVDDNPFYLAVVNERNVDAHASALPMDVWLMYREPSPGTTVVPDVDFYSEVTVELPATDSKGNDPRKWIQMVMIPRAEMEANEFKAGTGCEPYFYTNMLDDIKNNKTAVLNGNNMGGVGYPGHDEGADCGDKIVITSTPGKSGGDVNNSRARVYFYIDENTNINNADTAAMRDNPAYMDRMVSVNITYRRYRIENGVEVNLENPRYRTLDIEQRGLRRVPSVWQSNPDADGNRDGDIIPETYIEYTEEYLSHSDPLEYHVAEGEFYQGLSWGLDEVQVNYYRTLANGNNTSGFLNNYDDAGGSAGSTFLGATTVAGDGRAYNVYKKNSAMAITQWVIANTKTDAITEIKLYNTSQPQSAFHYCYGKNKRDYDGSVPEVTVPTTGSNNNCKGWYMPGIRELECAIVHYWNTFTDFQNKFYWSSACGGLTTLTYNSADTHKARATKVDENGRYVNSGPDGGDNNPGYKDRTEDCRIRAFYRRN